MTKQLLIDENCLDKKLSDKNNFCYRKYLPNTRIIRLLNVRILLSLFFSDLIRNKKIYFKRLK